MGRPWTQTEEEYVKVNYPTMSAAEMAQYLGRSKHTVKNRAYMLGVRKFECVRKKEKPKNRLPDRLRPAFREFVVEVAEEMRGGY